MNRCAAAHYPELPDEPFGRANHTEQMGAYEIQATFRQQNLILLVFQGPGFRLEAIFLRRATMRITITTNTIPAIMRIVVGSIEALSLRFMRQRFRYSLRRILPNSALLLNQRVTQKYFETR